MNSGKFIDEWKIGEWNEVIFLLRLFKLVTKEISCYEFEYIRFTENDGFNLLCHRAINDIFYSIIR